MTENLHDAGRQLFIRCLELKRSPVHRRQLSSGNCVDGRVPQFLHYARQLCTIYMYTVSPKVVSK